MPAQPPPRRHRTWVWSVALLGLLTAALLVWLLRERPGAEGPASAAAPRITGSSGPGPRAEQSTGGSKTDEAAPAPREVRAALPPFTGRVLSGADGRGIAGAEVTFFAPEGATSVRSGPDGRFQLVPSRAGPHQLAAVLAEGYVPFGPEWGQSPIRLLAPAPPGTPELVVSLEPEIRLKGRVEAQDGGAPIGGATVTLRLPGTQPGVVSSERRWTTDGRGEFSGAAPAEGMLLAQAAGFSPAVEPLRGTGETRTVTLRLKTAPADAAPEPPLGGRVVDDRGAPVPDAVVTLGVSRRPREGGSVLPAPVAADAQGRFRFEAVPAQVGWAQARAGDLLSERVGVEPGQAEVVLTVHPGGVLAGRVVHADGRPATAFALQLVRLRRGEPSRTLSVVDPDGQWEVRGLASGAWELQALAADSGPSERVRVELPASPGARVEKELRLRGGRRLSGVVRDMTSRVPIAGARVAMESSPGEDSVLVRTGTFTAADGAFQLEGVPDTPVSVSVEADRYNRRIVTVARGRTQVEVSLRPLVADQTPTTDLVGIGAVVNRTEDGLVLGNLVASGGAAAAGLHPGDVVLRVDGLTVAELGFTDAVQRLRGEEGTMVRLEVRRADGTTAIVDVPRRPISF
ncbi:MAG: carboxypeptidase regulatory-like domain-containing protein [Myxococcaceae bacterium]